MISGTPGELKPPMEETPRYSIKTDCNGKGTGESWQSDLLHLYHKCDEKAKRLDLTAINGWGAKTRGELKFRQEFSDDSLFQPGRVLSGTGDAQQ